MDNDFRSTFFDVTIKNLQFTAAKNYAQTRESEKEQKEIPIDKCHKIVYGI